MTTPKPDAGGAHKKLPEIHAALCPTCEGSGIVDAGPVVKDSLTAQPSQPCAARNCREREVADCAEWLISHGYVFAGERLRRDRPTPEDCPLEKEVKRLQGEVGHALIAGAESTFVDLEADNAQLRAQLADLIKPKLFPIQRGVPVPWCEAERAYITYAKHYGTQQSLERLAQRGGFGVQEFLCLWHGHEPGCGEQHPWISFESERVRQRAERAEKQLAEDREVMAGLDVVVEQVETRAETAEKRLAEAREVLADTATELQALQAKHEPHDPKTDYDPAANTTLGRAAALLARPEEK